MCSIRSDHNRRGWLAAACLFTSASCVAVASAEPLDPLDPLVQAAQISTRATDAVLIAATRAGNRLVVAGEGGTVLCSDDQGKTWQQASVPVSVTLTGLSFPRPLNGWAVGHSGVVLATNDGGKTWHKQRDGLTPLARAPDKGAAPSAAGSAGDPLLDVYFADASNGFVIGAFGLMLRTRDGGKSWESWAQRVPNPDGNHLYAMRAVGRDLYIVGERGSIFVSSNGGDTFDVVTSPYEGSFFGLTEVPGGGVLLFGLRGHAFLTSDRGQHWTEIKIGNGSGWLGATLLADKRVVLVSQAGELALSENGGLDFTLIPERFSSLTGVVGAVQGAVVIVGMRGTKLVQLPAAKTEGRFQ